MMQLTLFLCTLLMIFFTKDNGFTVPAGSSSVITVKDGEELNLSVTEAFEMVKDKYASNFEKVYYTEETADKEISDTTDKDNDTVSYYYKLPAAEYYLTYEGQGETQELYLFHLYEFVIDEPDTGIGHTVTYGWYSANKNTGEITDETR